jgi:hypothetical protein
MAEFVKDLNVRLHVGADYSEAEQAAEKFKKEAAGPLSSAYSFMGSAGSPSGSNMTAELASGQMRDMFRELISVLKENTAAKGGGGNGGGAGAQGGSGGVPEGHPDSIIGPGSSSNSGIPGLTGRKSLNGWEVQRLTSDPVGGLYGMAAAGWMQKAGSLAMGDAATGLGTIGALGSTALIAGTIYAGYKTATGYLDEKQKAGLDVNDRILGDVGVAAKSGVDVRGPGLWNKDRLSPLPGLEMNFDYVRQGLDGFNTYLGDRFGGQTGASSMAEQAVRMAKNQIGVDPGVMTGFMGASWQSGAAGMNSGDTLMLLKRIASATEEGKKNGVTAADSLQAISGLMHMEQSASGAVGPGSMDYMQKMWQSFQAGGSDYLRGSQGASVLQKLGQNQNQVFRGRMLGRLLGPGGHLSKTGESYLSSLSKGQRESLKGATDSELAYAMTQDPAMKIRFAEEWVSSGGMNGLPMAAVSAITGLDSGFQGLAARNQMRKGMGGISTTGADVWGFHAAAPGSLEDVAGQRENTAAIASLTKEIATTAVSINLLNTFIAGHNATTEWDLNRGRAVFGDSGASRNPTPSEIAAQIRAGKIQADVNFR